MEDLNNLVDCELGGLVGSPCQPQPVKNAINNPDQMPADIRDLRSADLLQTIPGSIDIDKIFADFQAEVLFIFIFFFKSILLFFCSKLKPKKKIIDT